MFPWVRLWWQVKFNTGQFGDFETHALLHLQAVSYRNAPYFASFDALKSSEVQEVVATAFRHFWQICPETFLP